MQDALVRNARLREEGTRNLVAAAVEAGATPAHRPEHRLHLRRGDAAPPRGGPAPARRPPGLRRDGPRRRQPRAAGARGAPRRASCCATGSSTARGPASTPPSPPAPSTWTPPPRPPCSRITRAQPGVYNVAEADPSALERQGRPRPRLGRRLEAGPVGQAPPGPIPPGAHASLPLALLRVGPIVAATPAQRGGAGRTCPDAAWSSSERRAPPSAASSAPWPPSPAPRLGAVAIRAALERAGVAPGRGGRGRSWGTSSRRAWARRRPARPPSSPGLPETVPGLDAQQGLRLGPEGGHLRRPGHRARRRRGGGGGRHGVDVERPVLRPRRPQRRPHGPRRAHRRHDPRRPLGRLRPAAHGDLRRAVRRHPGDRPGRPGRLRRRVDPPRRGGLAGRAPSRPRSRRSEIEGKQGREDGGRRGRRPQGRQAGEDPVAQAGLQEGRHGDRRQRLLHQRRRRGGGAHERGAGPPRGARGPRPAHRLGRRGPRAGRVHHRPGRRHPHHAGQGRPGGGRRRPLGDQRGLRGGLRRQQPAARPRPGPRSTSAAARWRSATPSAPPGRASW